MKKGNVITRMVPDYQKAKAHIGHKTPSKYQTL
jgi:hypothetical protein